MIAMLIITGCLLGAAIVLFGYATCLSVRATHAARVATRAAADARVFCDVAKWTDSAPQDRAEAQPVPERTGSSSPDYQLNSVALPNERKPQLHKPTYSPQPKPPQPKQRKAELSQTSTIPTSSQVTGGDEVVTINLSGGLTLNSREATVIAAGVTSRLTQTFAKAPKSSEITNRSVSSRGLSKKSDETSRSAVKSDK